MKTPNIDLLSQYFEINLAELSLKQIESKLATVSPGQFVNFVMLDGSSLVGQYDGRVHEDILISVKGTK